MGVKYYFQFCELVYFCWINLVTFWNKILIFLQVLSPILKVSQIFTKEHFTPFLHVEQQIEIPFDVKLNQKFDSRDQRPTACGCFDFISTIETAQCWTHK